MAYLISLNFITKVAGGNKVSVILLMNNGYPTEQNPKHSSYIKSIKESLEAAGHKVELCCLNSNFKGKFQHFLRYLKYYLVIYKNDFSRYDYVLMNHYGHFSIPIFKSLSKMKQPVIHWHGEDLFPKSSKLNWFFNKSVSALPAHTKHITPSNYFKQQLFEKYKIPLTEIFVSPSGGIDTSLFTSSNNSKNKDEVLRLGFGSGLTAGKGADFLLKLLENIKQIEKVIGRKIELHYIYYGAEKNRYDLILQQFEQSKRWDVMPSDKMVLFYQSIDILLFPTARKQESLGLVSLEAMSCNVPVLGPNAYAVPEYVQSLKSGEIFMQGDFDDFKKQLIYMATHLSGYHPRVIVISNYAKSSVVNFYRQFFS